MDRKPNQGNAGTVGSTPPSFFVFRVAFSQEQLNLLHAPERDIDHHQVLAFLDILRRRRAAWCWARSPQTKSWGAIMALFGTPLAHEDHAVRAYYAAGAILSRPSREARCAAG
jgi:hypothetical protein